MSDDHLDELLRAARDDRPTKSDEDRMESAILGAIAAGAPPLGRLASLKMFATVAIVSVGVVGVVTYASHEERVAQQHAHAGVAAQHRHAPTPIAVAPQPPQPEEQPALAPAPPVLAPERTSGPQVAPQAPSHVRVQAPAPVVAQAPATAPAPPLAPVVTPEPALAPAAPLAPAPVARVETAPPSELSLVASARIAMRRHDASAALRAATQHDALYPSGELSEELAVYRVEALASLHRSSEARARATQFAQQWPASPYRDRIRAAVGEAP